MKEQYSKLPFWGKIIVWVVIAIIIYIIFKKIMNLINSGKYRATVNQAQQALNQLAQQGVKPSYGQAQYGAFADTLQSSFQGCSAAFSPGDFWGTLEPVFKAMKNDADMYALIIAYGIRTVDRCGIGTGDFEGNLPATLGEKFSGIEGSFINGTFKDISIDEINKILRSNGLSFTF